MCASGGRIEHKMSLYRFAVLLCVLGWGGMVYANGGNATMIKQASVGEEIMGLNETVHVFFTFDVAPTRNITLPDHTESWGDFWAGVDNETRGGEDKGTVGDENNTGGGGGGGGEPNAGAGTWVDSLFFHIDFYFKEAADEKSWLGGGQVKVR